MFASLNQISTPILLAISTEMIVGGGLAVIVLNTLFLRWFLGKIQSEPVDEPEADEIADAPEAAVTEPAIRTSAGVPRSRPIQPVNAPPAGVDVANPIRLATLAEKPPVDAAPAPAASAPVPAAAPVTAPSTPAAASSAGPLTPENPPGALGRPSGLNEPAAPVTLARLTGETPSPTASLTALPPEKAAVEPAPAAPKPEPLPATPAARITPSVSPLFASPEAAGAPAEAAGAPPILPPLNFTKRASASDRPGAAPILGGSRPPGADLIITPNIPPASPTPRAEIIEPTAAKPVNLLKPTSASPAADLIFVDKPTVPLSSVTPEQKEGAGPSSVGGPTVPAKQMSSPKPAETPKSTGADLIAISPADKVDMPAAAAEKPVEPASEPAGGGLMLIPSSPTASPVAAESEKPAAAPSSAAPTSWKTRLLGRPRIFLPTAGVPAAAESPASTGAGAESPQSENFKIEPAAKTAEPAKTPAKVEADIPPPVTKAEPVVAEVKASSVEKSSESTPGLKASTEGPAAGDAGTVKEGPTSADLLEVKSASAPESVASKIDSAASVAPQAVEKSNTPSIDIAPVTEVAAAEKSKRLAEDVTPALSAKKEEAPMAEAPKVATISTSTSGPNEAPAKSSTPVVAETKPSAEKPAEPEKPVEVPTPVAAAKPAAIEPVSQPTLTAPENKPVASEPKPVVPEPKLVAPEPKPSVLEAKPVAQKAEQPSSSPILPAAAKAAPVIAGQPPREAAAASNLPVPIRPVEPVMNPQESTVATPAGGRASAQITLGFEITSLQLTPFFKLGAVQLRSLSNVVSLHLVASQAAENPLAAGISFQIESVDLDDSAHIKSILLKPLGGSQPGTVPQPKLQVENVKIGAGSEGAIEITSSQQTSTAVQMLATCTIAAMDFTPSFEIGSLRLEPNSNSVMLRLAPSSRPAALDLPPSFEVANVQLEGSAQLANVRLVPSGAK